MNHVMAKQVGPADGKPTTMVARRGRCQRLAPVCAHSIMARGHTSPTEEAEDTFAVPTSLPSHLLRVVPVVPVHSAPNNLTSNGGPMS